MDTLANQTSGDIYLHGETDLCNNNNANGITQSLPYAWHVLAWREVDRGRFAACYNLNFALKADNLCQIRLT
jgi:hypothetical protein